MYNLTLFPPDEIKVHNDEYEVKLGKTSCVYQFKKIPFPVITKNSPESCCSWPIPETVALY
jgi:hypothetical protein